MEENTTGKDILDFTEIRVMLQENCLKLFKESVNKHDDDFIIWLACSSSKDDKGRSRMTSEGARPRQGTISNLSLSKGSRSGSFLTGPVKSESL